MRLSARKKPETQQNKINKSGDHQSKQSKYAPIVAQDDRAAVLKVCGTSASIFRRSDAGEFDKTLSRTF